MNAGTKKAFLAVIIQVMIVVGLMQGWRAPVDYSSSTGLLPDTPKANELVKRCRATSHFGDEKFNSSWRFSMMGGDVAFFYCYVEEKIDWRERGRLDFCATNPPQRYNWTTRIDW